MAFADVGDVRLFFTDDGAGSGPPILFVHGYACDSQDWNWQIPHFVSNHRVIALDLRATGGPMRPRVGTTRLRLPPTSLDCSNSSDAPRS
jgi:pimeloyl-ACP methyl ester carboxylesterase